MKKRTKKAEKAIRESLIQQLKDRGADVACFIAQVDDYMYLSSKAELMKEDIETRGFTYTAVSSQGKTYEKDNPNVKNLVLYSKQMLQILKDLGLQADRVIVPDEDEL